MMRSSDPGQFDPEKFDSRFDPRFQPGYQEQPGDLAAASTRSAIPSPEVLISPPPCADAPSLYHQIDAGPTAPEPIREPEPEPNPFERILWIFAAVLVVAGVAVAYWANSFNFMGNSSDWSWPQMLQSSAWALSGPMVTVGLAAAVGLLFRRAVTWKPQE